MIAVVHGCGRQVAWYHKDAPTFDHACTTFQPHHDTQRLQAHPQTLDIRPAIEAAILPTPLDLPFLARIVDGSLHPHIPFVGKSEVILRFQSCERHRCAIGGLEGSSGHLARVHPGFERHVSRFAAAVPAQHHGSRGVCGGMAIHHLVHTLAQAHGRHRNLSWIQWRRLVLRPLQDRPAADHDVGNIIGQRVEAHIQILVRPDQTSIAAEVSAFAAEWISSMEDQRHESRAIHGIRPSPCVLPAGIAVDFRPRRHPPCFQQQALLRCPRFQPPRAVAAQIQHCVSLFRHRLRQQQQRAATPAPHAVESDLLALRI